MNETISESVLFILKVILTSVLELFNITRVQCTVYSIQHFGGFARNLHVLLVRSISKYFLYMVHS
jgi:hypothetical protein